MKNSGNQHNQNKYNIFYSTDVLKKDLPLLDKKVQNIIKTKISKLSLNPFMGLPLKNELKDFFKLKVSKYRIVYEVINDKLIVHVIAIAKRDNAYVYKIASKRARKLS